MDQLINGKGCLVEAVVPLCLCATFMINYDGSAGNMGETQTRYLIHGLDLDRSIAYIGGQKLSMSYFVPGADCQETEWLRLLAASRLVL